MCACVVLAEEAEEEEEEENFDVIRVTAEDVPQAFTHFTYRHTHRKFMVCDLQGVLDMHSSPPLFELTDPVIHYKSDHGRSHVFGRTDRGLNGMHDFFRTHMCSDLCRALNRRWVRKHRSNTDSTSRQQYER